ncbi:MAG: VWA domain-containing protein [Bdellovibrionota bacterium]
MTWANPGAFWLFIPLLAALFFYWRKSIQHRSRLIFPFDWSQNNSKKQVLTPFRLQGLLQFAGMSFLIIALARPQRRLEKEKRIVEAVDLMLVFDLSKSMEALDFSPNRRRVAIDTLTQFISKRMDDRIGLVLFSGEAYLSTPLTIDHKLVLTNLKNSSNSGLEDGTAIGQSLAVAVSHLKNSAAKSRVILLVTDGDNNMGSVDPVSAAQIAAGYGLKIYTIGIGKKGRVPYPILVDDGFGRKRQMLNYLTDAANDELLKRISDLTGGRFFSATDQNVLPKIFQEIDRLEKSKVEVLKQVKITELADSWMWLGLFILCIQLFALQTLWRKYP